MDMAPPALPPVTYESLGDQVYRRLRELILGQHYVPGSRLKVEQLCRELGVSRTPVWDAMRRLETEGLIHTVPRQGVFVLNHDPEHIRQLIAVREALEGLAARLAAEKLAPQDGEALRAVLDDLVEAERAADLDRYARHTIDFHNRILAASRNQVLARLLENIYAQMHVLRLHSLHRTKRLDEGLSEHIEIHGAVTARDPDRAERAARVHARRVLEDALGTVVDQTPRPATDPVP
jgi:DNA-binding GntR family transcriptional regulator